MLPKTKTHLFVLATCALSMPVLAISAFVAPSLNVTGGSATFGTLSSSNDTVSDSVDIEITPTYNYRGTAPEFQMQFFDANGNQIGSTTPHFIPSQLTATCQVTTTGTHGGGVTMNGRNLLDMEYQSQPPNIHASIKSGRYRYVLNEALASSGCSSSSTVASGAYFSAWSPTVSYP